MTPIPARLRTVVIVGLGTIASGVGLAAGARAFPSGAPDASRSSGRPEASEIVSVGPTHGCRVSARGELACWGDDRDGQATPPAGTFLAVASGWHHTCALRTTGAVVCWGRNDHGQTDAPSGTFAQLAAGSASTCGVRTDGDVVCWGRTEARSRRLDSAIALSAHRAAPFECPSSGDEREARRLFDDGVRLEPSDPEAALARYTCARRFADRPAVELRIGITAERLHRDAAAAEALERYLALAGERAPDADATRRHVRELRDELARRTSSAAGARALASSSTRLGRSQLPVERRVRPATTAVNGSVVSLRLGLPAAVR